MPGFPFNPFPFGASLTVLRVNPSVPGPEQKLLQILARGQSYRADNPLVAVFALRGYLDTASNGQEQPHKLRGRLAVILFVFRAVYAVQPRLDRALFAVIGPQHRDRVAVVDLGYDALPAVSRKREGKSQGQKRYDSQFDILHKRIVTLYCG